MKNLILFFFLMSISSSFSSETRYSRAITAYTKAYITPIKLKIPKMIEKLKVYKKHEDKLNKAQKKDMENIILTLKRYNFIDKLNTIFERCHENLLIIPDATDERANDSSVNFNDPTLKQARIELNAAGKTIKKLLEEYPEISKEPEIIKIMRTAFSEPKKKKKRNRRS